MKGWYWWFNVFQPEQLYLKVGGASLLQAWVKQQQGKQ